MSLKDRQLKRLTDEAVRQELLAGRSPETTNVERRISASIQGRNIGAPRYVFTPVQSDERSNPDSFNETMNHIHEDLELAFEEVGDQNDTILAMSNMYETEKKMLQLSVHKTLRRIETLSERLANRSKKQVIDGTFRTFNDIDFEGNGERGIPATDAFVDLENSQVNLRTISSGVMKYDLSKSEYTIEVQQLDDKKKLVATEEQRFTNILRDTVNETWRYVITKDKVEETYADVIITLPEKVTATRLTLGLHSPKMTTVTLYLSEDKASWKELKTYTSYEKADWTFDASVQYIKIRFKKSEPDFVDGTTMEYFFGASNLSLKRETYAANSHLVSTPYPISSEDIDKITLITQDGIAPQTNLHYYVGVDDGISFVEWQEVSAGQTIQLHQLGRDTLILNPDIVGYGEGAGENFGVQFYSLADLPDAPIERKTKLYAGEYMWKMETKVLTGEIPEAFMPTYQDWQDIRGMETAFIPVEETYGQKSWNLTSSSLQKFTTYVQCEKEENVYNAELSVGTAYHQVYVNNSLIKPVVSNDGTGERYKYNYRFQPGWNKIEILTYAKESAPFKPSLYLRDISTNVYAMKDSMREVSSYDLFNNTSKRAVDRFAIDGNRVLVNYDPKKLDVTGNGVRYVLEYEYLPKDARTLNALRFMTVLSRQDVSEHITPVVKGYKLILE